ncbi:MAG: hypothetical protein AB7S26_25860 [Sandaracinaceae bacterium]
MTKSLVRVLSSAACAFLIATASLGVSTAFAQDDEDPGASRSTEFEAATGPNTENIPGGALMVGAYGAILALLIAYVVSIGFRQSQTGKEIASLRGEITRAIEGQRPSEPKQKKAAKRDPPED